MNEIAHYFSGGAYEPVVIANVYSLGYSYPLGSAGSTTFSTTQGLFVTAGH